MPARLRRSSDPRVRYKGRIPTTELERALRELSQAAPDEFVLVRSRLERELRGAGDADGAAELRRRRRPHLAAWACNQLAHREPDLVEDLLTATAEVAGAQNAALRGEDADQLRTASRERQDVLERAADAAVALLRGVAPDPKSYRDNILATLDAASVDPGVSNELRDGLLAKPLRAPSGFEMAAWVPLTPTPSKPSAREHERARREVDAARSELAQLHATADELDAERASADLHANSTKVQVGEVEQALVRAKDAATAADAAVAEATQRLEESQRAVRQATERLHQAEKRLAQLDPD